MANEFTRKRVAKLVYSFASDSTLGVAGTLVPVSADEIPIGAVITKAVFIGATMTSANANNATIAITGGGVTIVGAGTLTAQVLLGTAVTDMLRAGAIVTGLGYIPIVATATAPLAAVCAVSTIASGGFTCLVEYIL
jgi:hypothetical protein